MKLTKKKIIILILALITLVFAYIWGGNYAVKDKKTSKNTKIALEEDKTANQEQDKVKDESKNKKEQKSQEQESKQSKNEDKKTDEKDEIKSQEKENKQTENQETKETKANENTKDEQKQEQSPSQKDEKNKQEPQDKKNDQSKPSEVIPEEKTSKMEIDPKTGKDKYLTDPVPEGKPLPVEWQDIEIDTSKELSCILSVRCDTILDNMNIFNKDKIEVLPKDGVIFAKQKVTFYKGESVFNVLQREMKKNKIHMEFVMTPMYNSVYIEGINNLYEFDTGELSGWMYKVNDWFPNYGASRYQIQEGDVIEWVYTCDLGRDVGGFNSLDSEIPQDKKKALEQRKEKQSN